MLGAIIGDIVGSRFEWDNNRSKEFEFFTDKCFVTDDSIMSLAVAKAILESKKDYSDIKENTIKYMQKIGRNYPDCGYGGSFYGWIFLDNPQPYNSYGNGSAMRISAVGFAAESLEETKRLSELVTSVSHNHPEGIKGAEATAVCIYFTLDEIRDTYKFNETCQDTVPQALEAFFESKNFEDAIRNAISIGGDSDTVAAICGGIAEAYYGVPEDLRNKALKFLNKELTEILVEFEEKYIPKIEEEKRK